MDNNKTAQTSKLSFALDNSLEEIFVSVNNNNNNNNVTNLKNENTVTVKKEIKEIKELNDNIKSLLEME